MISLAYAVSDTLVLAKRSLLRIPRAPDLLLGFTAVFAPLSVARYRSTVSP